MKRRTWWNSRDNKGEIENKGAVAAKIQFAEELAAADSLRDQKLYAQAANRYRAALALDESQTGVRKQLANMLKDSKQFEAAEIEYQICKNADPSDSDTLIQMGHLFKLRERLKDSKAYFEAAIALNPDSIEAARELKAINDMLNAASKTHSASDEVARPSLDHSNETALNDLYLSLERRLFAIEEGQRNIDLYPSLERRLSSIEDGQRNLEVRMAELRQSIAAAYGISPEVRVAEETMKTQWHSFVPLLINMTSIVTKMGGDLQRLSERVDSWAPTNLPAAQTERDNLRGNGGRTKNTRALPPSDGKIASGTVRPDRGQ